MLSLCYVFAAEFSDMGIIPVSSNYQHWWALVPVYHVPNTHVSADVCALCSEWMMCVWWQVRWNCTARWHTDRVLEACQCLRVRVVQLFTVLDNEACMYHASFCTVFFCVIVVTKQVYYDMVLLINNLATNASYRCIVNISLSLLFPGSWHGLSRQFLAKHAFAARIICLFIVQKVKNLLTVFFS